jgi:hypothetical protein
VLAVSSVGPGRARLAAGNLHIRRRHGFHGESSDIARKRFGRGTIAHALSRLTDQ